MSQKTKNAYANYYKLAKSSYAKSVTIFLLGMFIVECYCPYLTYRYNLYREGMFIVESVAVYIMRY